MVASQSSSRFSAVDINALRPISIEPVSQWYFGITPRMCGRYLLERKAWSVRRAGVPYAVVAGILVASGR
jgi:hypothetical protein